MSNFTLILTDTRKKLLDDLTKIKCLKYCDKSNIIEQALEMFLNSIKSTDVKNPQLYIDEFSASDYLKSIRKDDIMWKKTSDAIMLWYNEHNRIDQMED